MGQTNNIRKSGGICEKLHNAVSPFRSRIRPRESDKQTIPVEFNHFSSHKLVASFPAGVQTAGKENTSVNKFDDGEILVMRGQKFTKHVTTKHGGAEPDKGERSHARFSKASKDEELAHEGKFSEYISKVKNRMMKSESNVGRGISLM